MLLRSIAFAVLALPVSLIPTRHLFAQQPSHQSATAREVHVWRLLFRQSLAYNRLADEADAAGTPKPYLRYVLSNRLGLSPQDAGSLLRLSLAYQSEVAPIREDISKTKATFLSELPSNGKPTWKVVDPPAALKALQDRENVVALRYRDLLQNDLGDERFQALSKNMYLSLGIAQP